MVLDVHRAWAWVVVIANGLAGAWALAAHRFPALRSRTLWWFILLAEVTIFVQVALGVYLVAVEDVDVGRFHMFYGFVSIAAVGIIYSYRSQLRRQKYLLYGFGGLFLMGLGIRAMILATPGAR